ncbi:GNAT family N-acetyltransferase [Trebonia kvetii]|uniref:GNAT family N-acetyltransferase n=1 Tax=Trebonia kvetii TaxID=2480626 RepID=A0A6P2C2L1_9ACTN|nr:GNAT family N-acetyltransferase [Trebonia kvetii]TVZ05614.1 GNAT family N-acetyltransferase [Trebonia kvetii]
MAIAVRLVTSDGDYTAWRQVRLAVVPRERADSAESLRAQAGPQLQFLLAEADGVLAGSGVVGKSDLADRGAVSARVLPDWRRRGIGTAILRELAERAAGMGFAVVGSNVEDAGSVRFAERYGFREVDRQVEQVRVIGGEPVPQVPEGVVIVPVSSRPGLWRAAYQAVGVQAFKDMATLSPLDISLEQWEREWITDPDAMFVALAKGEVIGCAGLLPDTDDPGRAEHAVTVVRRDWRRRGVAVALKQTCLVWAASHELREVYTWTQRGNDGMRALNTRLGFSTRTESLTMQAGLPLTGLP